MVKVDSRAVSEIPAFVLKHLASMVVVTGVLAAFFVVLLPFVYTDWEQFFGLPMTGAILGLLISVTTLLPITLGAELLARRLRWGRFSQILVASLLLCAVVVPLLSLGLKPQAPISIRVAYAAAAFVLLGVYWWCLQLFGFLISRHLNRFCR